MSKSAFANTLVDWYQASHRDLPWRNTTDPYHIWLSEVMLQQTQVRTVIDYYHQFLKLFPTIQDLANASSDQVMKAWEGLGYYARCRNMHQTAKQIVENYGGQFPSTIEEVEALPGIGRSTAGAILTFGHGQRHPLLDGNVKRVLTRLYDIDEDPANTPIQKRLWEISEALLGHAQDPYSYNQAIMELGATVCLPQNPHCMLCPVQNFCDAFKAGTQHERPVKGIKKALPHYSIAVGVIWQNEKILIQRRPEKGMLGGLWEFPGGKQEPGESLEATTQREIEEELDITITVGEKIATVKHTYTHFKITLHAYHCRFVSGAPQPKACEEWRWVSPDVLPEYAFPKANKVILEHVVKEWQQKHQSATV